ncbi:DUF7502 family protein [Methanosarcina sp. Mfa9]|uniref:DUF7502 family protein n=1 Tax=Methanosarcina sp. Mfa9 TaxID=3439063 RepID=UPI003F82C957
MALEIEKIVTKHESALKRYRGFYFLADLLAAFLVLYALFTVFNMQDIFFMFPVFEPYTGARYDFLGFETFFETLGMAFLAFSLSLALTAIRHYRTGKKDAISLVEEKYPVLKERLRTAYDNRELDNIIVQDLIGSVILDSKPVKSSAFLNRKKLAKNFFMIVCAVVVLVYVAETGYQGEFSPTDLEEVIEDIPFPGSDSDLFSLEDGGGTSEEEPGEDLFGEPAVIVVEGTEVDLKIPPGAGLGFTVTEEGEERDEEFIQSAAYDPEAIASQAYYDNLPEGYRSIIQSYFEELAEE